MEHSLVSRLSKSDQPPVPGHRVPAQFQIMAPLPQTVTPNPMGMVLDMSNVSDMSFLCFDLNFNKIGTDRLG